SSESRKLITTQESPTINNIIGIDLGYSEVFVDNNGNHYGIEFGKHLQTKSDHLKQKNQKRNKLFQLAEKYINQNKLKKARNIQRFNLGKIKYNKLISKQNATSECIINQAINQLISKNPNKIIVTEKLDKLISKNLGKNWNRRLSSWIKGTIRERIEFKALAKGFSHKQVNASYTSQTCPTCGFVDRKNRKQDKFGCLNCGHEGHSDQVAATNIANRYLDPQITIHTPYREVKQILLARFHRQLESVATFCGKTGTVTDRTLEPLATVVNQ
ncbi:MAG: hypothetical protein E6Q89_04830, partial [Bacteroidia bacterium]